MPFSMKTIRKLNDLAGGGNGRYKGYGGGGGGSRRQGYGSRPWTGNTPGGPERSAAKSKRKLESSSPGILQFVSKGGLPPRKKQPKPKKLDREDSLLQSLQEDAAGGAAASGGSSGGGGEAASASAASAGEIASQGGSSSIHPLKRHRGIVSRTGGTSGRSALLFGSTVSQPRKHASKRPAIQDWLTRNGEGHAGESNSVPDEIFPPATARSSSPRRAGGSRSSRRASPGQQKHAPGTSTPGRGSATPPANAFAVLMGSKARGRQGSLKKKAHGAFRGNQ